MPEITNSKYYQNGRPKQRQCLYGLLMQSLGHRGKIHSHGNRWISGSLTRRRNGAMINVSEGTLPTFLGCKGDGGEIYLQACKIVEPRNIPKSTSSKFIVRLHYKSCKCESTFLPHHLYDPRN